MTFVALMLMLLYAPSPTFSSPGKFSNKNDILTTFEGIFSIILVSLVLNFRS